MEPVSPSAYVSPSLSLSLSVTIINKFKKIKIKKKNPSSRFLLGCGLAVDTFLYEGTIGGYQVGSCLL